MQKQLLRVGALCGKRDVLLYASGFLQKPWEQDTGITGEDINGLFEAVHSLPRKNGLVLVIHTPGGEVDAVKSVVEYLHGEFADITAIVPYMAMSGGTMMSLACNRIIMARRSQLGPIDPQMFVAGEQHPASAICRAFKRAEQDIVRTDVKYAHLWAPILQTMGPSLVIEAEDVLEYSKDLACQWLHARMFSGEASAGDKVQKIAEFFNAENEAIYSHGQRIAIDDLQKIGVKVQPLEKRVTLQRAVTYSYYLMTLIFELTDASKFIVNQNGDMWSKGQSVQPGE